MTGRVSGSTEVSVRSLDREVAVYFLLAIGLSWLAWLPVYVGYGRSLGVAAILPGAFGPAVAAAVVTWRSDTSVRAWLRTIFRVRLRLRWYAIAILGPVVLVVVASLGLPLLDHAIQPSLLVERVIPFLPTLLFMAVLGGGQEEIGWRGFALPRLQARHGPIVGSVVLGAVWAVWHLPLFAIETTSQYGSSFLLYAAMVLALTFLFTWLYNRSRSVVVVGLAHGSFNAALGLFVPLPATSLTTESLGTVVLVVTVALWLVVLGLLPATRDTLGYGSTDDAAVDALLADRSGDFRAGRDQRGRRH